MKPSLSVVLPLRNVQSTVAATVDQLVEALPELTDRFEIVLVDDASTDATSELVRETSICYPQVQLLMQSAELGPIESFRGAIRYTHGEFLLSCTDRPSFDLHEIGKLWERRKDDGAVWARSTVAGRLGSIPGLPESRLSATADAVRPDLLLVPRRLLTGWTMRGERSDALSYLRQRGYPVERIEIRRSSTTDAASARRMFAAPINTAAAPTSLRRPTAWQTKGRERLRGR